MKNRSVPIKARLSAWRAIVLPSLMYGAEVWEGDSKDNKALEVVMNDAVRLLCRCNRKTSLWAIRAELGLQRLSTQRMVVKLRQAGRVAGLDPSRLVERAMRMPVEAPKSTRKYSRGHLIEAAKT